MKFAAFPGSRSERFKSKVEELRGVSEAVEDRLDQLRSDVEKVEVKLDHDDEKTVSGELLAVRPPRPSDP